MIKKCVCILFLSLFSSFIYAESIESVLKKISEKSSSVSSIMADFLQVKSSEFISTEVKSDGTFYYSSSDKVCLKNDDKNYLLMNGEHFVISTAGDKMSVNTKSNPMVSHLGNLLKSCVTGDFNSICANKKSTIDVEITPDRYILTITMAGSIKRYFSEVKLTYFKHDASLEEIKMTESNGDFTSYTFSNHKFNVPILQSVFNLK